MTGDETMANKSRKKQGKRIIFVYPVKVIREECYEVLSTTKPWVNATASKTGWW